jgi:hypothetical protein
MVEDYIEGRYRIEECYTLDRRYIASRARQLFNYRTMTSQYIEAYEKVISDFPAKKRAASTVKRVRPHAFASSHHDKKQTTTNRH